MASIKRPIYKVETKLAAERKRRKSDLVIMWQSVWDVTAIIVKELWLTLIRMWEFIQLWFSSSERFLLQTWLERYLPYVPEDFSESWRDGRLLAILLNNLQPGCFPDANRLDPDYGLKNVYRVFDALEMYFGIKPNVSVEEIVTCSEGSDSKLFEILLELKNLTDNQPENENEPVPELKEQVEQSGVSQSCIAKGTGLVVGFVGKVTNFMIFCAVISDLDVVVEIRGPNSICSERITKRSPKRRRSISSWESARPLTRSMSFNENNDGLVTEEDESFSKRIIPLQYEIIGNQISLSYKPKEKGKHKVTILWHGQHVSDSPYIVTVEDPSEITGINNAIHLKSVLKTANEGRKNEVSEKFRKISVRFQELEVNEKEQKKRPCKILSRRILRYIVKIHGKDIPVNAENTESLAAELLKMDYDFEKCPSFHRRNSWGFAGDAERKKSVIRQFGIDANELEAQISQRRSRSLSVNPGSKQLIEKSDSFDSLTSKLNILNEDTFENSEKSQENEEDFAYVFKDVDMQMENKIKCSDTNGKRYHKMAEQEISELSSELTENKFDESLKKNSSSEVELDRISSLSTDIAITEEVDNSNEDLQCSISRYPSTPEFSQSSTDKIDNILFNYTVSNIQLHHKEKRNEKTDSDISKYLQTSINNKIKRSSKMKKYENDKYKPSHPLKMFSTKRKQSFYKKIFKNKNSSFVSTTRVFRKRQGNNRHMFGTKNNLSALENVKIKDFLKSSKSKFQYENEKLIIDSHGFSNESLITPRKVLTKNAMSCQNDATSFEEQRTINNEQKKIEGVNHTFRNIAHYEETRDETSKSVVEEPKVKKLILNRNLNTVSTFLPNSKIELKGSNISKTKPLRTHTLKPIGQFFINHSLNYSPTCLTEPEGETKDGNAKAKPLQTHILKTVEQLNFKQFNPPFEMQNSISPVKMQIGQWENTLSEEKQNTSSQRTYTSDSEQVNIKEKLAFWENACKSKQSSSEENVLENNRKTKLIGNKKLCMPIEGDSDVITNDLHNLQCTGNATNTPFPVIKDKAETCNSINKETNVAAKKQIDDKISTELQVIPQKIRKRSFSDPIVSETAPGEPDVPVNFSSIESSKRQYSSSSIDDNSEQYVSDDSEDSGCDYILPSTEDEYIDDEISENASEYWGNMSIVKGWKVARCAEYSFFDEEFLQNYYQQNKSYPKECKVFGIAVYYGYVAVKNRFQVYTGEAGFGNLSVSMQGCRLHDVSFINVAYMRNDVYEVTYQVMTAGYYLISIRWMDKEIPGSPFVCKVTF